MGGGRRRVAGDGERCDAVGGMAQWAVSGSAATGAARRDGQREVGHRRGSGSGDDRHRIMYAQKYSQATKYV